MLKYSTKAALLGSAMGLATGAFAAGPDFTTDVEIRGSLCVGTDCSFSENFGFDTLRLKENNLRVHFNDTSSSGSFPNVDWRITINDSNNGGGNYFRIDSADNNASPFQIDYGAPNNSLRVDANGDIGIGVDNPVTEVQIADGDTPTVRLEQNGTSGWTPQTWDLAGNETNFFLRDVTNGSQLPFRVKPNAGNNALVLNPGGKVGMGTNSPVVDLHVARVDQSWATLRLEALSASPNKFGDITFTDAGAEGAFRFNIDETDGHEMSLDNDGVLELISSQSFNFLRITADGAAPNKSADITFTDGGSNGAIRFNIVDGDGQEMSLDHNGNMTISGTLTTNGPSCASGCDRVFDEEYSLRTIEEHAELMWTNGHLPAVGPTRPGQPVNITDKMGNILNELEHAHIYIAQQQLMIDGLSDRVAKLETTVLD
ncbi:hypothetical protein [Roseovarius aestuariivivens]|uniref:hypothetical protein n=1 Tax=Roseovarius aestuariivivens TaxID=1888910 RepID=UPI001081778A|nr:hypothetical protein [Roseovarius aestuariivivens]